MITAISIPVSVAIVMTPADPAIPDNPRVTGVAAIPAIDTIRSAKVVLLSFVIFCLF